MKFSNYANSGIFTLMLFNMLINVHCPNQIHKFKKKVFIKFQKLTVSLPMNTRHLMLSV